MKKLLTSKRMQQIDAETTTKLHLSSLVLMERAALCTVNAILKEAYDLSRILVICGCGNNGGDGVAVARILKERKVPSDVFVIGDLNRCSESLQSQIYTYEQYGCNVTFVNPKEMADFVTAKPYTLIIDAIFGVGLNRELKDDFISLIDGINHISATRVSVDIPSGLNATKGIPMGASIKADLTVTYGYYKIGQFLYPGADYCGKLVMDPIGILQDINQKPEDIFVHDQIEQKPRPAHSNKGTFGKLLIIAGSKEVAGAAIMAAESAFRSGVGMVKVITHESNRELIAQAIPEAMISTYSDETYDLSADLKWANVVAIGPGISLEPIAKAMLKHVFEKSSLPVVADADAITLLSQNPAILKDREAKEVIITPHVAEFSRISGLGIKEIQSDLIESCRKFAEENDLICVLKDSRSIISDGQITYLNATGNSGMATAGSGDVLFGLIASLLAQGYSPLDAASKGCFIHGSCGDCAAKDQGESMLIATDLIKYYHCYLS